MRFRRTFLPMSKNRTRTVLLLSSVLLIAGLLALALLHPFSSPKGEQTDIPSSIGHRTGTGPADPAIWLQRARAIDELYHLVYTPCWEGAYGAIGDAYLFAACSRP